MWPPVNIRKRQGRSSVKGLSLCMARPLFIRVTDSLGRKQTALVSVSTAVISTNQKQREKERVCFLQFVVRHPGKSRQEPGGRGLEAGVEAQAMEEHYLLS